MRYVHCMSTFIFVGLHNENNWFLPGEFCYRSIYSRARRHVPISSHILSIPWKTPPFTLSPPPPLCRFFFFPTGQKHMVIAKNQFYKHTVCIYSSPKTLFVVFKQTNKEREIDHWFWSNDTACILIQTE